MFHHRLAGAQDQLVTRSREWVAKMKELGMEVVYVEFQGGTTRASSIRAQRTFSELFAIFNIVRDQRPETK